MDAATQSRARLTLHAIERQSRLLVEALDQSLVDLPAECVRWGAVSDPQRWMSANIPSTGERRDAARAQILELAPRYMAAARDLEVFIASGAAGHDCDAKAEMRNAILGLADQLADALKRWLSDVPIASAMNSPGVWPQYVHRTIPRACGEGPFDGSYLGIGVFTPRVRVPGELP